jgi:hypothetical protein
MEERCCVDDVDLTIKLVQIGVDVENVGLDEGGLER